MVIETCELFDRGKEHQKKEDTQKITGDKYSKYFLLYINNYYD